MGVRTFGHFIHRKMKEDFKGKKKTFKSGSCVYLETLKIL